MTYGTRRKRKKRRDRESQFYLERGYRLSTQVREDLAKLTVPGIPSSTGHSKTSHARDGQAI